MSQHPGRASSDCFTCNVLSLIGFSKTLPSPRLDPPKGRVALGDVSNLTNAIYPDHKPLDPN